jgi:hypothetical protein
MDKFSIKNVGKKGILIVKARSGKQIQLPHGEEVVVSKDEYRLLQESLVGFKNYLEIKKVAEKAQKEAVDAPKDKGESQAEEAQESASEEDQEPAKPAEKKVAKKVTKKKASRRTKKQ